MPYRQLADAGASSTCASPITNSQTTVTLQSASGFPAIVGGGQLSVIIYDSGALGYVQGASPFTVNYEYQPVNGISGNVLTFGPGGGAASRAAYAGTTPKAYSAGATIAVVSLAEDIVSSAPWKFDEQSPTGVGSITIPASGSIPSSYLGVNFRDIQIRWKVRTTSGNSNDLLEMQFNGDGGNNYAFEQLVASGSTPTASNSGATSVCRVGGPAGGGNTAATAFGIGIIDIIDAFSSSTRRQYGTNATYGVDANGVPNISIFTGQWFNASAAITSIAMLLSAGQFAPGSRITTYLIP